MSILKETKIDMGPGPGAVNLDTPTERDLFVCLVIFFFFFFRKFSSAEVEPKGTEKVICSFN